MNWQIGDVAILVNDGTCMPDCLEFMGSECLILCACSGIPYDWEVDCGGEILETRNSSLRPLPPPNEVTTWDTCEFQPRELIGVEHEVDQC